MPSNADLWRAFDDPTLDCLIETGVVGNLDIVKQKVIEEKTTIFSPHVGVRRKGGENLSS